jgi:hypothetical protein
VFVKAESDRSSQADRSEKMSGNTTTMESLNEGGSVEEAVPAIENEAVSWALRACWLAKYSKHTHHETLYTLKK